MLGSMMGFDNNYKYVKASRSNDIAQQLLNVKNSHFVITRYTLPTCLCLLVQPALASFCVH